MNNLSPEHQIGNQEPGDCLPWVPDFEGCCEEFKDHSPELQTRALSLAWSTVRTLTGGRVGNCPVTIRPCLRADPCVACFGDSWLNPYVDQYGNWKNAACRRSGDCSCCDMCEIIMPGPVAAIQQVLIDGYRFDIQLFRIDNGNRLVRQDGRCWPGCQNLTAPLGAIGTFGITYIPGILPTEAGMWAVSTLACEYAKACTGGKCRLPSSVTAISRQGVSMELSPGMFDGGTGIREVDAYIYSVNPHGLKTPPKVMSPDMESTKHRVQTFQPVWSPKPVPMDGHQ